MRKSMLVLALGAAALVLSACGGGDDGDGSVATDPVPASASQSVDGLIDYLVRLVATAPDNVEPVDVNVAMLQVSETDLPRPID